MLLSTRADSRANSLTTTLTTKAGGLGERVSEDVKAAICWGVGHRIPKSAIKAAAKRGDLQGRLILAGSTGSETWAVVEAVRAAGPLHKANLSYLTVDHATVKEVLTGADFRTSNPFTGPGLLGRLLDWSTSRRLHPLAPPSLLVTEPPDHTRYRRLVTRVFTVRAVEDLRARTEQVANDLLDSLDPTSPVDLVETYCSALPVMIIAEILGVPLDEHDRVLAFGSAAAPSLDFGLGWREFHSVRAGLADFETWLVGHFARLRSAPGDDLLSQLVSARDEQGTLSDEELIATAGLVLAAGFETTVNLLSNGIALLAEHPDQLERLRAEPAYWPGAVDEVLRLDPPVMLTARLAARTTSLAGVELPAGAQVVTILAGANRDPGVFAEPNRFDVTRENARDHVSFSSGRHYCLGASLARMEGEVGLRTLFDRFPDLRLEPGAVRRPTRILRGYQTLPVRLTRKRC